MSATLCDQLIERGVAELQAERYAQAARTLADARELAPNDAEILSLLGLALMRSGNATDAGPLLARAVEIEPAEPGFAMNLAEWHAANGQRDLAIAGLEKTLAQVPGRPRAWERLGDLFLAAGDAPAAARAYDRMLQLDPRNPAGPAKICTAMIAARDWGGVADIARAWSTVAPDSADAWRARARGAWEQGLFRDAMEYYERVLALRPGNVAELCTAARICLQSQDFPRAEALLTDAGSRAPAHPEVLSALGMLRICQGRFEEAEGALLESLAMGPGNVPAYTLLGRLRGGRFDEAQYWSLKQAAVDTKLPLEWRIAAGFALGDALHARGEHPAAFAAWQEANALARDRNAAEGIRYQPEHVEARIQRILDSWREAPAPVDIPPHDGPTPIFVVGMPRSGTTLVEAVLAAHPEVTAGGERQVMRQALDARLQLPHAPEPQTARAWRDACLADFPAGAAAGWVTDKNPLNIEAAGLIAELFPEARIVYLSRDPIACGFSVFRHEFQKYWGFAHALEDIAHYQAQCARLAAHWELLLGDRFVRVDYEDFAGDFPQSVAPLLAACGLAPSDRCERFQEFPATVGTLSAVDVRGPVRVRNEGHAPYAEELGVLREALARHGLFPHVDDHR